MNAHDTQAFERQRDEVAQRLTAALKPTGHPEATFLQMQKLLIGIEQRPDIRNELRSYIGMLDLDDQHPDGEPT
jgi:hypothetical protein